MSDRGPIGILTADYIQDSFHIYTGKIKGLRALLLLELEEEGEHVPFVYTKDEHGSVLLESLLSETLVLNGRTYKVIMGMYHEDILDKISSSIDVSPWEYSDYVLSRPPNQGSWWGDGSFFFNSLCYKFEDNSSRILDVATEGNCFVASFSVSQGGQKLNENRSKPISFSIKRIVQSEGKWDAIAMGSSERVTFSGSTYVEPRSALDFETVWGFVSENAWGIGAVIILLLYLAINGFRKKNRHAQS